MPPKLDLEREFFRVARDADSCTNAKKRFMERIMQISGKWVDDKLRLGILGLEEK